MKVRGVVASAMFVMGCALIAAPAASAQPVDCSSKIVDTTDAHVLDQSAVSAAIQSAEKYGADVYVRAFQKTPGGSGDAFWNGQEGFSACANWRSADGAHPKSNVVMLSVGMDRQGGLFYGSAWSDTLDDNYGNIVGGMKTNFGKQDYTNGMTGALDKIAQAIDPAASTATSSASTDSPSNAGAVFAWILAVLGGIILTVLIGLGIGRLTVSLRTRRETRAEMLKMKERAGNAVTNFPATNDLMREYEVKSGNVPASLKKPFDERFKKLARNASEIIAGYNSKVETEESGRLSTSEMSVLCEGFRTVAKGLTAASDSYDTLKSDMADLVAKLSPSGLAARLDTIDTTLQTEGDKLSAYKVRFDVSDLADSRAKLATQSMDIRYAVSKAAPEVSHADVTKLEASAAELVKAVAIVAGINQQFDNGKDEVLKIAASTQSKLDGLTYVDTAKAKRRLDRSRSAALSFLATSPKGRKTAQQVKEELESKLEAIRESVSDDLVTSNNNARRAAQRRTSTSSGYARSGSGYSDGLVTGAVIGSTMSSNSGSHSSSSDSTPSYSPSPSTDYSGGGGGFSFGGDSGGGGFSF